MNKIITFQQFRQQCEDMFLPFSEHSTMHDLRVWDKLPFDILHERQCWYCAVRLSSEIQMMITYDPKDDDPRPFVCWYDYQQGTTTYPQWAFDNLEDAMLFCCREPHYNYQTSHRDNYILYRDTKLFDGTPMWQVFTSLSLLTAIDFVQKNYDNIPDGVWELKNCRDGHRVREGITEYKLEIKSGRKNTAPFTWCALWEYPLWIYDFEIKSYYE